MQQSSFGFFIKYGKLLKVHRDITNRVGVNMLIEAIQQKITHIEERIIENIAESMRIFGISATVGRVLGTIYMNGSPMTLDTLSEATGLSKTRMSQVVREMVEHNIAYKVFEKGVRKDLYNVEHDYYQTFISLITSNWQMMIKKNRRTGKLFQEELLSILEHEELDETTEHKVNQLLEETKKWLDYYDWLHRFTDLLDSGEIFQYVPKSNKKSL